MIGLAQKRRCYFCFVICRKKFAFPSQEASRKYREVRTGIEGFVIKMPDKKGLDFLKMPT